VQAVVLMWLDANRDNDSLSGEGFIDWKPYDHPTLGQVEIGGFTRYWLRNPPPGPFLQQVAIDQARFAVVHALTTPRVKIRGVEVESGGDSSWTVTATVVNEGYLDTSLEQGRRAQVAKPDVVTLDLPQGASTKDPLDVEFPFMRGHRDSTYFSLYRATWQVDAVEGTKVEIELRSEKGGVDRQEVVLEE
jgi:hypothetical protein